MVNHCFHKPFFVIHMTLVMQEQTRIRWLPVHLRCQHITSFSNRHSLKWAVGENDELCLVGRGRGMGTVGVGLGEGCACSHLLIGIFVPPLCYKFTFQFCTNCTARKSCSSYGFLVVFFCSLFNFIQLKPFPSSMQSTFSKRLNPYDENITSLLLKDL